MADIFDYLDWRGDIKFAHSPFCGMDGLVFAELSYLDFTNIVPSAGDESATSVAEGAISVAEAARVYFEKHPEKDAKIGAIVPAKIVELFRRAAASRRFADIGLSRFVDVVDVKAEKQFSALCARIDEKTLFTAYRGTDDTIIGWRENFNMCFKAPVPSQLQAAEYLNDIGAALAPSERLIIGGHSKGGNLAVWAASHCSPEVTNKIAAVYNFDGPGFNVDFRGTDGYLAIKSRIRSIVPECSVVGMFLDHEERYMVVKSSRKGIAQHDALSWSVIGSHFERAEGLSPEIIRINGVLASWIKEMDNERLEKFTECFFGLLLSTKAETITGLMSNKKALLKALTSAEPETRKALFDAFKLLLGESGKSVTGWLRRKEKKTVEMSVK